MNERRFIEHIKNRIREAQDIIDETQNDPGIYPSIQRITLETTVCTLQIILDAMKDAQ